MMTTRQLHDESGEAEVERRYARGEFPAVDGIPCGCIVINRWTTQCNAAEAV